MRRTAGAACQRAAARHGDAARRPKPGNSISCVGIERVSTVVHAQIRSISRVLRSLGPRSQGETAYSPALLISGIGAPSRGRYLNPALSLQARKDGANRRTTEAELGCDSDLGQFVHGPAALISARSPSARHDTARVQPQAASLDEIRNVRISAFDRRGGVRTVLMNQEATRTDRPSPG
jgi:hypothetical protein